MDENINVRKESVIAINRKGSAILIAGLGIQLFANMQSMYNVWRNRVDTLSPKNAHLEYVNKDTLLDLVFKSGEIYLQSKEGKFVPYETILKQERQKADSICETNLKTLAAKRDSSLYVYNNKINALIKSTKNKSYYRARMDSVKQLYKR